MSKELEKEECKNCKEVKLTELSERVAKIEQSREKEKHQQKKQDMWNKTMTKIMFYGALASGITAICSLPNAIVNLWELFKGKG